MRCFWFYAVLFVYIVNAVNKSLIFLSFDNIKQGVLVCNRCTNIPLYCNRFNSFLGSVLVSYSLKTPENIWFSGVFRGIKWEH